MVRRLATVAPVMWNVKEPATDEATTRMINVLKRFQQALPPYFLPQHFPHCNNSRSLSSHWRRQSEQPLLGGAAGSTGVPRRAVVQMVVALPSSLHAGLLLLL